jgi:hypothetical protein
MVSTKAYGFFAGFLLALFVSASFAGGIGSGEQNDNGKQTFWMSNDLIKCAVVFENGKLASDRLEAQPQWSAKFGARPFAIETDADFALEVMWTGWRAPGKSNNAENPITFGKQDFRFKRKEISEHPDGSTELAFHLESDRAPFRIKMTYRLEPEAFYARRKVAVSDTAHGRHFLRAIWPRCGLVPGAVSVVKAGGFGQPIAFQYKEGGAFFGLEWPAAENMLQPIGGGKTEIRCGQEIGQKVGKDWIESEWVVAGLTPNHHVKHWFAEYVDRIRVAPIRPYTLYNSWYDLRSPDIVEEASHVMDEKNILRMIDLIRRNMIEKHGINLDAFVLDDGWDVYKSDWVLREKELPNGLKPIADELEKTKTNLGLWLGPTGGYSKRAWRLGWMKEHGYETTGDQLCVAGKNYHALLKKRVVDFVENDGAGYYKWDGIQFSCSEPDHGHPIDLYSRRAVLQSVIDLCQSVREKNPDIFLNITSGTWLSPWWVKYANQIWMQGYDYGYADVPSISRRDAAITYRDFVLFEDFHKNDFWFPIANLMTHGIIKGNLQKLGGEEEPLDKFTDNALLYFARGVSMWELYISPDLLTDAEWNALGQSIQWAKDRFPILSHTEMIGGDPGEKSAYGYVHYSGNRGIVAARNPFVEPQTLAVELSPAQGLDPRAASLVLERVYPTRWISPKLYAAGSRLDIPLEGYETAVYEIYPVEEASEPLLAGVTCELARRTDSEMVVKYYDAGENVRLLNPEKARTLKHGGKTIYPHQLAIPARRIAAAVKQGSVQLAAGKKQAEIAIRFELQEDIVEARLAVLFESDPESPDKIEPNVSAYMDGAKASAKVEKQEGRWAWHLLEAQPGKHDARIVLSPAEKLPQWTGKVSMWLVYNQKPEGVEISFELAQQPTGRRAMPPRPWPAGELRRSFKLGEAIIPASSTTGAK